jgi:hypothetical protein
MTPIDQKLPADTDSHEHEEEFSEDPTVVFVRDFVDDFVLANLKINFDYFDTNNPEIKFRIKRDQKEFTMDGIQFTEISQEERELDRNVENFVYGLPPEYKCTRVLPNGTTENVKYTEELFDKCFSFLDEKEKICDQSMRIIVCENGISIDPLGYSYNPEKFQDIPPIRFEGKLTLGEFLQRLDVILRSPVVQEICQKLESDENLHRHVYFKSCNEAIGFFLNDRDHYECFDYST